MANWHEPPSTSRLANFVGWCIAKALYWLTKPSERLTDRLRRWSQS